jgi:peptidoglycan/xylan/chitin deacetylase (PgdA/CDA1 family)
MLKKSLKHIVHKLAAYYGSHTKHHNTPQLLVLMYHRILPIESQEAQLEEPGMVVTPESFEMHLSELTRFFEFTTLESWFYKKHNNLPLPNKSCVITFDDGWQDNYQYAFPLLKQYNIPANIFLVSDMIGTNDCFWPEKLSKLLCNIIQNKISIIDIEQHRWLLELAPELKNHNTLSANNELYSQITQRAKKHTDDKLHHLIDNSLSIINNDCLKNSPSLLNWQQVQEMQQSELITFGSHTCNHSRLNNALGPTEIKNQVVTSKATIESAIDKPVTSFCYPNGDTNDYAVEQVKQNYNLAVTTNNGWNDTLSDPYLLKRVSIHEGNANTKTKFIAQISGWLQ